MHLGRSPRVESGCGKLSYQKTPPGDKGPYAILHATYERHLTVNAKEKSVVLSI